jgi:hypothetical protein
MAYIRNANLKSSQWEARQVEHIWLHGILRLPIQNSPSCHVEWSSDEDRVIAMVESHPACMVLASVLCLGSTLPDYPSSRIKYINGKLVDGCDCTLLYCGIMAYQFGSSFMHILQQCFFFSWSDDRTLSNWTSILESRQGWVSWKYGCCRCSITSLSYLFVVN